MYRIKCDGKTLHDTRDEEYMLLSPKITLELNKTGNLDFGILPTHPEIESIRKMRSQIMVYDDDELLYIGRPVTNESDFYNHGQVSCEGELAILLDSVQRPNERGRKHNFEPISTNREVFQNIIEEHNSQMEDDKKFEMGIVDIESVEIKNFNVNYEKTWDLLNSQFAGVYEGYLRVRHEGDKRYIDYVRQYGNDSSQEIRFGENLLDLKHYVKSDGIVTAIIPIGKNNVTVKNANGQNGKDYVHDAGAVETYGWIYQKVDFSEVNDPNTLLEKAREYLKSKINLATTIELTAIDLHLIDVNIDRIKLGDKVRVVSRLHHLDRYMMVSKREYNLTDPSADKITLGDILPCLSEKQAGLQKDMEKQKNAALLGEEMKSNMDSLVLKVEEANTGMGAIENQLQLMGSDSANTKNELQEVKNNVAKLSEENNVIRESLQEILERIKNLEGGGDDNA